MELLVVTLQALAGSDLFLGEEKGAYLFLQKVVAGTKQNKDMYN